MMAETTEQFLNRIYVNYLKDKVFIYKNNSDISKEESKCQIWNIQKTKEYLQWLRENNGTEFKPEQKRGLQLW